MTEQICENVDTTAEPPKCSECGGAGGFMWAGYDGEIEGEQCYACNATGYERGDTASLLAMVESLAELEAEQGFPVTAHQFQQIDARYRPGTDLIGVKLAEEAAA